MAAYAAAQPLPMGIPAQPAGRIDDLVADGLASFARMQADLAEIQCMAGPGPKGVVRGVEILCAEVA